MDDKMRLINVKGGLRRQRQMNNIVSMGKNKGYCQCLKTHSDSREEEE